MILGHSDPEVIEAVIKACQRGLSFGAPTEAESELAALIQLGFPGMEKMRFVSSGTEATMSAIRLARGFTERSIIIKCDGAYHGHSDSLLVAAGSGVATLGIPGCPGIPDEVAKNTAVVPFNDFSAIEKLFNEFPEKIAGVIIEPVCGNMGVVNPKPGYLKQLREVCTKNGALLIFDEVMTGFRAGFFGVSHVEKVEPDLTCLGKIVGGGMPLAVYGGKKEIMACIAPDGGVYQAGTLSGNPIAVAAGKATLKKLSTGSDLYTLLLDRSKALYSGLSSLLGRFGLDYSANIYGSMMTLFFSNEPVIDFKTAAKCDTAIFARWFKEMLNQGIYLAPSQFEAAFVSMAHSEDDIAKTLEAAESTLKSL
jgi:glutamate-1-semialdehyde 2,1-aminomutase